MNVGVVRGGLENNHARKSFFDMDEQYQQLVSRMTS